jgi:hypothetical protein
VPAFVARPFLREFEPVVVDFVDSFLSLKVIVGVLSCCCFDEKSAMKSSE